MTEWHPEINIDLSPPVEGQAGPLFRLNVKAIHNNEPGIFYRLTAVLYRHGWDIHRCRLLTRNSEIEDTFWIYHPEQRELSNGLIETFREDFKALLDRNLTVIEYLHRHRIKPPAAELNEHPATISIESVENKPDYYRLTISGRDRRGLLLLLAEYFFLVDLNIDSAEINSEKSQALDEFIFVDTEGILKEAEVRAELEAELRGLLGTD